VEVPFVVDPPADITPGYYVGGIVAESTTAIISKKGSVRVGILQAVGTRVYARIIGPLHPGLAITGMSIQSGSSPFGGSVTPSVTFTVANTGNVPLNSRATISLSPLFGGGPKPVRQALPQVLPHDSSTFTVDFPSIVAYGHLSSSMVLTAPGISPVSGSASTLLFPWVLFLIVIIVIATAVLLLRRHRRRAEATASPGVP